MFAPLLVSIAGLLAVSAIQVFENMHLRWQIEAAERRGRIDA